MSEIIAPRRTLTRNRMGWSSDQLSPLSQQFVEFTRTCAAPVLDIGAGLGAARMSALNAGANWHNVVVWRQENLAQYLTKGKQIYVEGRLQTRSYEDKDGQKKYSTEVVADDVILGSGGEGWGEATQRGPVSMSRQAQGSPAASPAPAKAEPEFGAGGISDDDVPF